jgi:release factor glutamine methyltransferase
MNIREAWAYGRSCLAQASSTPDLDSRLLLEYILNAGHSYLIAHGEESLTLTQEEKVRELFHRAQNKEPIPYLTGSAPFFGFDFQVNPAVLIPRPETEQLVERALLWVNERQEIDIVDVGTGSGCIAISLAVHLPQANIWATDISPAALALAQKNAGKYAPQRIKFLQGSLLSPLYSAVDLIVANLPYIADDEWTLVDDGVKWYEPTVALRGGTDGLDLIGELLHQAATILRLAGAVFLEIGWQQGQAVEQLAKKHFPLADIEVMADFAGRQRIISIYTG